MDGQLRPCWGPAMLRGPTFQALTLELAHVVFPVRGLPMEEPVEAHACVCACARFPTASSGNGAFAWSVPGACVSVCLRPLSPHTCLGSAGYQSLLQELLSAAGCKMQPPTKTRSWLCRPQTSLSRQSDTSRAKQKPRSGRPASGAWESRAACAARGGVGAGSWAWACVSAVHTRRIRFPLLLLVLPLLCLCRLKTAGSPASRGRFLWGGTSFAAGWPRGKESCPEPSPARPCAGTFLLP